MIEPTDTTPVGRREPDRRRPNANLVEDRAFRGFAWPVASTHGNQPNPAGFGSNPFAALSAEGLPPGASNSPSGATSSKPARNRGRVDVQRQTGHRGGKTVTVVKNFTGIGLPEKQQLAKQIQKACGVGGTVKEGRIEIQGDKREEVARILAEAGFRPVFTGG